MNDGIDVQGTDRILTREDHARDVLGMKYVYPVLSRRAGGISVGVNLNTNNACNWRCVYCQIDGLARGAAPPVDLAMLQVELDAYLAARLHPAHHAATSPPLVDVAIAGSGEPTSAPEFPEVVTLIGSLLQQHGLSGRVMLRVITNGSLLGRSRVQAGLQRLAAVGGEAWFKLDAGSQDVRRRINSAAATVNAVVANLRRCGALCPTWVQTCAFAWGDRVPLVDDLAAYRDVLRSVRHSIQGVLLYGIARPSRQPEAPLLRRLEAEELSAVATVLRDDGFVVRVSR